MTHKPGQGFKRGGAIKIRAIPYPLPDGVAAELIAASRLVSDARKAVEHIKEGCTPQKDAAIDGYESAVANLITTEDLIRRTHGVEYIREEILPFNGICK